MIRHLDANDIIETTNIIEEANKEVINLKITIIDYFFTYDQKFTKKRFNFLLYSKEDVFFKIEKQGYDLVLYINDLHFLSIYCRQNIYKPQEKEYIRLSKKCFDLLMVLFEKQKGKIYISSRFDIEVIKINTLYNKEEKKIYEKKEIITINFCKFFPFENIILKQLMGESIYAVDITFISEKKSHNTFFKKLEQLKI